MNILVDDRLAYITSIIDKSHKVIMLDVGDIPSMPYDDTDREVLMTQWVYSTAVDNDVDLVMIKDVNVARVLNQSDIRTVSLI